MQDSLLVAAALDDRHVTGREIGSGGMAVGLGRVDPLDSIPRPVSSLSVSRDLRRVVANVRDYRADVWMSKVIP